MRHAARIGAFGAVVAGLGVGAISVAASALAVADTVSPTSSPVVDVAAPTPDENFAISVLGIPIVQDGSAKIVDSGGLDLLDVASGANATVDEQGLFNVGIASGPDSTVTSGGLFNVAGADDGGNADSAGFFSSVSAERAGSQASNLLGAFDTVRADGDDAEAATVNGGNSGFSLGMFGIALFDSAHAVGVHSSADIDGLFDTAGAHGTNSSANTVGVLNAALADGSGSTAGAPGPSSGFEPPSNVLTSAIADGDHSTAGAYWFGSLAAAFGDNLTAEAKTPFAVDIEPSASSTAAADLLGSSWLGEGF